MTTRSENSGSLQPSGPPTRNDNPAAERAEHHTQAISGLSNDRFHGSLQDEFDRIDPRRDNWDTETFSELAGSQLNELAQLMSKQSGWDDAVAGRLIRDDFSCEPLRPAALAEVFVDKVFSVLRPTSPASGRTDKPVYRGADGLGRAVTELKKTLPEANSTEIHFKVIQVTPLAATAATRVDFQYVLQSPACVVQQNAIWECEWARGVSDERPMLKSIHVAEYEEVTSRTTAGKPFVDCTVAVLGGNACYRQQIVHGLDHWRQTLDVRLGLEAAGPYGLAVADVNGDGWDDVYMCETGGLPNRLFVQQRDGTALDVSAESGVDYLEPAHSALFLDLDNDGDQDLVVASGRFILIHENDGTGRFTRRFTTGTMSMARSLAAADYDSDGDVDIYVCGYFPRNAAADGVGLGKPMPYHDANNGVRNYLLANMGGWQFEDVTQAVGLESNNRRFSYAAAWEDYDNDGDQDLYVANDFGRNNLYRNDGGHFTDVAATAGVEDISAGMSVSWGDYNRDGLMDVYVGNMFSSAGNRITYQRRFKENSDDSTRAQYRRHARGNSLFENAGDGTFRDVSEEAGVTMGRWAWSSNFVDLNNDGWEDLFVANGMITGPDDPGDL